MSLDLTEQIRAWVAGGERVNVEFKSDRRGLNDNELIEAVVCLANGPGGVLLLGVDDDGTVIGAHPRHAGRTDTVRVEALIANRTQPPLTVAVTDAEVDGKSVLVVEVPRSPRAVGTSGGVYVRRAIGADGKPACLPYFAHEMLAREIDRQAVDWASLRVTGASWQDLDPLEFDRLRTMVSASATGADRLLATLADREIASALGVLHQDDHMTAGALVLFGRTESIRQYVPTHGAAFQVLRGTEVEVNDFVYHPLFRLAQEFQSRFGARNRHEELQFGLLRVDVPAYSETAYREALANALIHRDYTRMGAVHVRWSEDQLEISSPGGFPQGITIDNLLVAPPHPRSPLLADAFKRAGLVERTGRGVNRIFAEQLRFGRPAPDYGRSTGEHVVAILPGGPANLAVTRWVLDQEKGQGRPVALSELQVLAELHQQRLATTSELAHLMQRTEAETRQILMRMVERGWVEARGEGRHRNWHMSAPLYRTLHAPSGYVRIRGYEPSQQESMILQFVRAHGQVSRADVAELCSISPTHATRVLGRLVDEGKLARHGRQRSTVYRIP